MLVANLTLSYYRWSFFGSSLIVVAELQSFERRHLTNHYFVENISRNYLSLSSFHPRQKNGWMNYIFTLELHFLFLDLRLMRAFRNTVNTKYIHNTFWIKYLASFYQSCRNFVLICLIKMSLLQKSRSSCRDSQPKTFAYQTYLSGFF